MKDIKKLIKEKPYKSYIYSYPHKMAYRKFDEPFSISELWMDEKKDSVFLYFHIPFCQHKCGYCNLLSIAKPDIQDEYVKILEKESKEVSESIGKFNIARFSIGGGTPSIFSEDNLKRLFFLSKKYFSINNNIVPISVEISPDTISLEKLKVFKENKVDRISIGIQSFVEEEIKTLKRFQNKSTLMSLINKISSFDFSILNIDLIYGIPGQTEKSWIYTIEKTCELNPNEIYVYPLYIRAKTGLKFNDYSDNRMILYKIACKYLKISGYRQLSMRRFVKDNSIDKKIIDYSCQEDGMIGIGCGARSYTKNIHYSNEYAVSQTEVKNIIDYYLKKPFFYMADYGYILNLDEKKRRFVLKSILNYEGIDKKDYIRLFKNNVLEDFNVLNKLIKFDFAIEDEKYIKLTQNGLAYSDSIGNLFLSKKVLKKIKKYHVI